ncbi:MAG: acetyl-CoA synthase subunit gamma [Spirochaetes bacterium]|nr:acetyl-CoA synthase subunit gamma [Spirochaetota bacterium]
MKEIKTILSEKQTGDSREKGDSCCGPSPCCEPAVTAKHKPAWVIGTVTTPAGNVFKVATGWTRADHWGEIKSRIGASRMKYMVPPALYAVGAPDKGSDIFVSANYKLSFDKLRSSLKAINAWILVLDTKSINVWCASGKGTFGTEELVMRINKTRLGNIVDHKRIIVPQFGAVGVNAEAVRRQTGFRVYFGPVYAKDIPKYVKAGYKKDKAMSTARFTIWDRIVLTPMEINPAIKKYYPWYALIILIIFGTQPSGILFNDALAGGFPFLILGLISILAGAFLTPVLLPFVPFRSFAVKGWIVGMLSIYISVRFFNLIDQTDVILLIITYLFFPLAASYIALQFTGSTTYTGISGVRKELKISLPIYIAAAALSVILAIIFKLVQWGLI